MTRPLVSVVIPAFDVAPYGGRCLDSLLRQTIGFDRIEVAISVETAKWRRSWKRNAPSSPSAFNAA